MKTHNQNQVNQQQVRVQSQEPRKQLCHKAEDGENVRKHIESFAFVECVMITTISCLAIINKFPNQNSTHIFDATHCCELFAIIIERFVDVFHKFV